MEENKRQIKRNVFWRERILSQKEEEENQRETERKRVTTRWVGRLLFNY